ncbi:MAG: sulfurtransferase-like selenium metabolism protein YedF [Deltaproteobacteria bacterium]|nr:MAG: sulfurtransferase-like selenium metabolism protein YedF [Deltaproteobacteria bacterium]
MAEIPVIDLDLRGQACPGPVIETRKALSGLKEDVILTVKLDNQAACSNVTRFAKSQGFTVAETSADDDTFTLTITRGFSCDLPLPESQPHSVPISGNYIIYIDKPTMGSGDDKLGRVLMKAFLKTLPELENLPTKIIFLNQGVFLTATNSPELTTIQTLATAGCTVLVCGTCLDFYNLKDQLGVGQVSNMFEIATLLTGPKKVVRI